MKKKNFMFLMAAMMVAMLSVGFASCGSDDDDNSPSGNDLVTKAIGTWMCTSSTDSAMGYSIDGLMVGKEVTIKSNGTYTSTAETFGYSGTYTIKGNTITAKSKDGATFMVNVTISGDKMTWNGTASNGTTFKYVFTREV